MLKMQTLEDFAVDYQGKYELVYISEDGEKVAKVTGHDIDSVFEQSNKLENAVSQFIVEEYNNNLPEYNKEDRF